MRRIVFALLLLCLVIPACAQNTPIDPTTLTISELARLPLVSGRLASGSYLAPDGERFLHINFRTFCLYTVMGEEIQCADPEEQLGEAGKITPDLESPVWSPDGAYVAFATDVWRLGRDGDIWVYDVEQNAFLNVTDDGYDGSIITRDDAPDTAVIDVAPAWAPDGRLTFARHGLAARDTLLSLWEMTPDEWQAEKIADLTDSTEHYNVIWQMQWSPDGRTLAYIIDSQRNPEAGIWTYSNGEKKLLYARPDDTPMIARLAYSPDSSELLILSPIRQFMERFDPERGNGYYIVSAGSGTSVPLNSADLVSSAGWLPGGGLIYTMAGGITPENGGVWVTASADGEAHRLLDGVHPDGSSDILWPFAPTPYQYAPLVVHPNGRLLLGTNTDLTLVMQLSTAE